MVAMGAAIHHTVLLFALGGLAAYALEPLVRLVRRPRFGKSGRQIGASGAALAVFGLLGLAFLGSAWWLGSQATEQFRAIQKDAPEYRRRAIGLAHELDARVLKPRGVEFSAEDTIQRPPPEVQSYAEKAGKEALPLVEHAASNLLEATVVMLIALYFLIFATDMKDRANAALTPALREYAIPWERDVDRILGGFVRGQLVLAIVTGVAAAVGLLALGVHLWLLIGLFVALTSLIPVFGPYVGAVPALIAAVVGPTRMSPVGGAIAVLVLFVVLNEAGGKILYPKLVGKALNLHEVVVLFVLFAGLEVGGLAGTLFAAPVASLAIVTLVHLYRLWQGLPEEAISDEADREDGGKNVPRAFKRRGTGAEPA